MALDVSTEPHATANPVHEPAADLAARAAADGVRFLLALFVDLTGKPCAKLVPVEAADELQHEGVGFAGYAVGAIGQQPCDPDLIAIPDPASYTPLPWVREGLALVHCDPHVEGRPWPFAPRVILRQALAAAGALRLYAGAEVEYFLVSRGADGELAPADARDTAAQPCYDARGLTRMYDHLTEVSSAMNTLGWGNYANDHEDGNGQFEQNFAYADALTTADRVITARYLISVLAERRGMTATYMPKPFADRTGSGLHLHLSLWQDDTALFPAGGDGDSGSATFGLSALARSFLAGILDHAPGLQAVIAPTVNSYKRTGATATRSGATWSPRRATYGGNDRTHFIRVPDEHRIELRGADGSANPYLALAVALAAGLDGISRDLDPGPPGGNTGPELPPTLLHAVEALAADRVVSGVLDGAGPGVAEYFGAVKRDEFLDWHGSVGRWELDRYLTAF
ncbi:MAG TPA: type III glutamate--ammonia ligase [Pseudonocardia sp.]|nr:type III glutamate--ammonia ligase [Pseudonocardia sp.]